MQMNGNFLFAVAFRKRHQPGTRLSVSGSHCACLVSSFIRHQMDLNTA